jgi:hypothetical protein
MSGKGNALVFFDVADSVPSKRRKYCTRKGGEPDDECPRSLMVTLLLVTDYHGRLKFLFVRSSAPRTSGTGRPSGRKQPQDISAPL